MALIRVDKKSGGGNFVDPDKYIIIGSGGTSLNNLTSPLSVSGFTGYLINVSQKTSMTSSGVLKAAGIVNDANDLQTISVSANTPVDISSYNYICAYADSAVTVTFT